jgi:uncharacterized protein (DUF1800 family)
MAPRGATESEAMREGKGRLAARLAAALAALAAIGLGASAQAQDPSADAQRAQMQSIVAARPGLEPTADWRALGDRQKALLALERFGMGASEAELREVDRQGFDAWMRAQLDPGPARLPAEQWRANEALPSLSADPVLLAQDWARRERAANQAKDEEQKKALREEPERWRKALFERQAIFAAYSQRPMQEAAVAFWQDHFSLFANKGDVRIWLPAWDDNMRLRALGPFPELLASTAMQPAMLEYLDNARSTGESSWIADRQREQARKAGKPDPDVGLNENYARELMELHTLGVDGGYSQKDVRELARILTGAGVSRFGEAQRMPPELRGLDEQQGAFFFDPRRHDFGEKTFLGKTIEGAGFSEQLTALDMLAKSPKTAHHLAREFAVRYIEDNPPEPLVRRLAAAFTRSGGRFGGLVEQALREPDFWRGAIARSRARTPQERLWATLRLAYPQGVTNWEPAWATLRAEGDLPWDHLTPEGYPRDSASWSSPEQTSQAVQAAQRLGEGRAPWMAPDRLLAAPQPMMAAGAPMDASAASEAAARERAERAAEDQRGRAPPAAAQAFAIEAPVLSAQTLSAIAQNARNPQEAAGLLLASPEELGR